MELTKRFADFIVNKDYEDIPDKELRTAYKVLEFILIDIGASIIFTFSLIGLLIS